MSYLFIVVAPKSVKPNSGFDGFTSSSNAALRNIYGNMLDEVESSKQGIVDLVMQKHQIKSKECAEIRVLREETMPAQNKTAYEELAKKIALKENIADKPYHWDGLMWESPMYNFPTLVIRVPVQKNSENILEESPADVNAHNTKLEAEPPQKKKWWQFKK